MFRVVSVPIGFLIGIKEFVMFLIVFGFDILQMFFYSFLLSNSDAAGRLKNLILKILPSKEKVKSGALVKRLETMGFFGVSLLAALPIYAGGMWSAVIISHLMGFFEKNRVKCYCYLACGSACGSAVIVLGVYNILKWIGNLI